MNQVDAVPVERHPWPGNAKGLRKLTVPTAAKFIRRRIHDPRFRARAGQVLRDAGFPKGVQARCEALRLHVKSVTDYAADPLMSELVVDAEISLCMPEPDGSPAKMCMPLVDCDDAMVAVLSLVGATGYDVRLLLLEYGGGKQVHLMGAVKDERGQWLEVDVTTDKQVGHVSWAKTRTLIDPFDPKMMEAGEFIGGAFIGAGRASASLPPMDPAMRVAGAGAASVSDVLSYRALWDDYVQQTVCAYNVLAWALGFLIQGQPVPTNIDTTALPAIPYCSRAILNWDVTGPIVDTTQFADNPPTVQQLTSVQAAATTSAAALLDKWNVWSGLSDLEIVDDASKILASYQDTVIQVGSVERPFLARFAPALAATIPQGPNQSTQAQVIAQLEAAQIVAGNVLTVFGIGIDGVIQSTANLSQWTAEHAAKLGNSASGLVQFLLSPWTLSIIAIVFVGGVGYVLYKADAVAKIAGSLTPFARETKKTKKKKKRK